MLITVSGHHVEVSESFRQVVAKGMNDLGEKYHVKLLDVSVILSKPSHLFHTDLTSHIGRGVVMRASGESEDAYASFHNALETLKSRLRRHKKRLTDHHKHRDTHLEVHTLDQVVLNPEESEAHDENPAPIVIAEVKMEVPKLSVGDAVMRLDLSQESALMFRNAMNDRLNVLYKRSDGNIGWIDPK
jgi:ribosomal subunit interface protein